MPIELDRDNGIPLYIQLKNQVIKSVKVGELKLGDRMPTERELANELGISRKTVSHAYNLLEREGILVSHQGRGTFVADDSRGWRSHAQQESVLKFIDLAIESAFEHDISTEEFLDLVQARTREKKAIISKSQAIFVECNMEQARFFAKQLSEKTHFKLLPVTVGDLETMDDETRQIVDNAKIIIPTFNHVNEVNTILEHHGYEKTVMGVAITPNIETFVKIAKYPEETKFGLVCLSKEFIYKVDMALKSAGLTEVSMNATTTQDRYQLEAFLQDADVIIVSPGRLKEAQDLVGANKDVIRFDYSLDESTVKLITARLMERV